jgi:hypothetical protein
VVAIRAFHAFIGIVLFVFYLGYRKNLPHGYSALWQKSYLEGNVEMVSEKGIRQIFDLLIFDLKFISNTCLNVERVA